MSEVTYDIDITQLNQVLEEVFRRVPQAFTEKVLDKSSEVIKKRMQENSPVGRFFRQKPSLKDSIRIEREGDNSRLIGPTKKVDGHDLGTIMELGSKGGQIIKPKPAKRRMRGLQEPKVLSPAKKALRFYWKKTGKIHYMSKVTRGTIEPRYFIRKTAGQMRQELPSEIRDVIRQEYRKNANKYQLRGDWYI